MIIGTSTATMPWGTVEVTFVDHPLPKVGRLPQWGERFMNAIAEKPNWSVMTDVEKRSYLRYGQDWDMTHEERVAFIAWLDETFPGHGYTVETTP